MPEFRQDPIIDRWVIIAAERAARPFSAWTAAPPESDQEKRACPFCEGAEAETPPETYALRNGSDANGPGWRLRVVPNKFPALAGDGEVVYETAGFRHKATGVGLHEVIIETPDHDVWFGDLPEETIANLFQAVVARFATYRDDPRIEGIQFFKNHGAAAGASLCHPHSQIIGMPVVSRLIAEEIAGASRRFADEGECPYCQIITEERTKKERFVFEEGGVIAYAPWAPRFPFETHIAPIAHTRDFDKSPEETILSAARGVKRVVTAFGRLFGNPPFNMMLHTAPFRAAPSLCYHWRLKLMPTLGRTAGFEWSTGFHINTTSPEESARLIRENG